MKKILSIFLCFATLSASAQFYYKDIVTTQQTNETYQQLKKATIKTVTLHSFEANSQPTDGFAGSQEVNAAVNKVVTYTKTNGLGESFFSAWYNGQGQLIHTSDSSQEAVDESLFTYNAQQQLVSIKNTSKSDNVSSSEVHLWQYGGNGKPTGMFRIRNNTDTLSVTFVLDEKGNPAEERTFKNKAPQGTVYYYFDDQNRLTDVVRYNLKAKKLLPDYIFEYNQGKQLKQMISVPDGSSNYLLWIYRYNEQGLRSMELCYSKQKELLGKVEYTYE